MERNSDDKIKHSKATKENTSRHEKNTSNERTTSDKMTKRKRTHRTDSDDAEHLSEQGVEVHHGQRDGHLREAVASLCGCSLVIVCAERKERGRTVVIYDGVGDGGVLRVTWLTVDR